MACPGCISRGVAKQLVMKSHPPRGGLEMLTPLRHPFRLVRWRVVKSSYTT